MEVLVVDDEPLVRELIAEELAETGLSVAEASSAEVALARIHDDAAPPTVIITDVNLGTGMDGIALAGEVRRRWPRVCLVVVSGDTSNLERLPPGTYERTYAKPFDPRRLAAEVQILLSRAA
ncbi:response regulator [Siccirubricoccus phaeus]|uniref:response regulator n=1 Tax=Siccirubricoccus phaeus TaxID=2595053 RepID=UPI0011F0A73A|nr:response regulator [Siccirubricoccus phaeus]